MLKTEFLIVRHGFAAGVFFKKSQSIGNHAHYFIVALGFSQRLNHFLLVDQETELPVIDVRSDVFFFQFGADRQDNVRKEGIVFHPGCPGTV